MSFIFYTAENLKAVVAYVFVTLFIIYTALTSKQENKIIFFEKNVIYSGEEYAHEALFPVVVGVFYVISVVLILPTYANAKYFFFLMPFIMHYYANILGHTKLFKGVVLISIMALLNIVIFYL